LIEIRNSAFINSANQNPFQKSTVHGDVHKVCPNTTVRNEKEDDMRRHKTPTLVILVLVLASCGCADAKDAGNPPYVATLREPLGPFYARCLPAKSKGNDGTTQILLLRPEGDTVITTYSWYNAGGIEMGWSPKAGKIAVMRLRQDSGLPAQKQTELSFYLGDRLLWSYTTADLAKLGAKVKRDVYAIESGFGVASTRAAYDVEGCVQAWSSNDYYFKVRLDDKNTLNFDILTGKLCRVERVDNHERLVPEEGAESIGTGGSVEQKD
jgi:hypothetical protein